MNGAMLLQHAAGVVDKRRDEYGEPEDLFENIAASWSQVVAGALGSRLPTQGTSAWSGGALPPGDHPRWSRWPGLPADEIKREGWRAHGILVVAAEDGRHRPGPSGSLFTSSASGSTDRVPLRGSRVAKRRRRIARGKGRQQRSRPEVINLPGGRKAEMVREADPEGQTVAHARTVDTLARMLKAGTITRAMYDAARDFQAHFTVAAYDAMPPRNMVRVSGGGWTNDLTDNQIAARNRVVRSLGTLGGPNSPGGSCVWHVVGLGHSLREWAVQQGWSGRPMYGNQATGVLVAALGVLAVHYGYGPARR